MKTIHVTILDEILQQLIDKYKAYSPAHEEMEFSVYLALEELKRFRQASTAEPKPLSLDELRERDKPVYVPLNNGDGYWCLCKNGYITPPSLLEFFAGDRPNWVFYDRQPRRDENV